LLAFFPVPSIATRDDNEAPEMRRDFLEAPRRCADATLVRDRGLYWRGRDGMIVHVAAREERRRATRVEPRLFEACAPEGGVVHAPRRAPAQRRDERAPIGAAGLAMALWLKLFANSA
jgi:hypothetical protein